MAGFVAPGATPPSLVYSPARAWTEKHEVRISANGANEPDSMPAKEPKRLILIDAMGYIFHASYAPRPQRCLRPREGLSNVKWKPVIAPRRQAPSLNKQCLGLTKEQFHRLGEIM